MVEAASFVVIVVVVEIPVVSGDGSTGSLRCILFGCWIEDFQERMYVCK